MELGNKESYDDWLQVFRNLKKRGLCNPVPGVTDSAPGLIKAFEEAFSQTLRQRCLVHKKRNILSKVSQEALAQIKLYLNAAYYTPDKKTACRQAQVLREQFAPLCLSAIAGFDDDFDACLAHLQCLLTHRRFITSTHLIERSSLEEKRCSKTIFCFFTEKSGLKPVFASLVQASYSWKKYLLLLTTKCRYCSCAINPAARLSENVLLNNLKGYLMQNYFYRKNKT